MSVKEFFAYPSIKLSVMEFLKVRANFSHLDRKFKKPFRAHINKHMGMGSTATTKQDAESSLDVLQNYFVSDGFNSIRCSFSRRCQETFKHTYPESVRIPIIINMLICVEKFRLELRAPNLLIQKDSSTLELDKAVGGEIQDE